MNSAFEYHPMGFTINSEADCQKILHEGSPSSPSWCHDALLETSNSNSAKDATRDPIFAAPCLPPVTCHMSCYIRRASPRFTGQGKWADAPSAAEIRFTRKYLGEDTNMSMIDVQKGKDIFLNGIKDMPDEVIQDTVLAAQAECEHAHLIAIASAWGLEKIERHASAFADIQASAFHLSPFKHLWKYPLDSHEERIYDELYTSDSWMAAQDEVQKLPKEPGCGLERVAAGLMFFSDATHLANFRMAKAWPLYMYFGNLTKYTRSAPKSGACHLVGFLPSCAIPVFEGRFPAPHDVIVQSLLYRFAQWHALAKLRLHSESTLDFLEDTFKKLSRQLRKFHDCTCAAFSTVELPKEKAARLRKFVQGVGPHDAPPGSSGPKVKMFNLNTYKFHAMGDYVHTIKFFGTTDSFTTQIGELAHRALKSFYPLTSKHHTSAQLAKHERRCRVLRRVEEAGISSSNQSVADSPAPPPSFDLKGHHFIATGQKNPVLLFGLLQEYDSDPAIKVNFYCTLGLFGASSLMTALRTLSRD
ncbi:hypothetical protein DFJ58DRAFT_731120 [Suillus subalutaceus]|uniref:uncharacterized protein n=1 Tax=Suillus subalutaceus TaxID=48586 RepID=UPI001B863088|nr:uncharacterized protein DFJ58DRAFT_731120 [Suillus subalutaceus]KAG1844851.1 hypothetical protein DFJ58DRAFT_731120 [Suillus subalutaceus]